MLFAFNCTLVNVIVRIVKFWSFLCFCFSFLFSVFCVILCRRSKVYHIALYALSMMLDLCYLCYIYANVMDPVHMFICVSGMLIVRQFVIWSGISEVAALLSEKPWCHFTTNWQTDNHHSRNTECVHWVHIDWAGTPHLPAIHSYVLYRIKI